MLEKIQAFITRFKAIRSRKLAVNHPEMLALFKELSQVDPALEGNQGFQGRFHTLQAKPESSDGFRMVDLFFEMIDSLAAAKGIVQTDIEFLRRGDDDQVA